MLENSQENNLIEYGFADKDKDLPEVLNLLNKYPKQFVPELANTHITEDWLTNRVSVAKLNGKIIGCVFFDNTTKEFNWLAIYKSVKNKKEIAKELFNNIILDQTEGMTFHWYVNTEDASIPQNPEIGRDAEPARTLYKSWNVKMTRIENKFGIGGHAYKCEQVGMIE